MLLLSEKVRKDGKLEGKRVSVGSCYLLEFSLGISGEG